MHSPAQLPPGYVDNISHYDVSENLYSLIIDNASGRLLALQFK